MSKGHGMFGWTASVAMACFVLLAASGLTTTYAYVSPSVTRQSSLYELKLIVERAELSLSSSPEQQARSLLKFAKRRTDELRTLSLQGKLDTETLAAIVRYTEEALALADKANDTTTQSDIRELVAKEAAEQRATLQELLISLGISSLDGTESLSMGTESMIDVPATLGTTDEETSVVLINVEDIKAYERTISEVGSVEVNALEQITSKQPVQTERPPDLSLTIPIQPDPETTVGTEISFTAVINSTGVHPIDTATITVDWGDGRQSVKVIGRLAQDKENTLMFTHTYNTAGAFIVRIVVSEPSGVEEWTTANNRDSLALTILKPLCDIGTYRCDGSDIVEICAQNNGAASWRMDRSCHEDEFCSDGACVPQCVSSCEREGELRCNTAGTSTEICERRVGCFQWRTNKLCNDRCVSGDCVSTIHRCGDSTVSDFEECDDGNTLSGDGCTASCRKEVQCTDDDGGNTPTKQGTVRGGDNNETDFCEDPNTLLEFTCSIAGTPFANRLTCPNGCRNGACLPGTVCGNNSVESDEECDDGNRTIGDGCSNNCKREEVSCTDTDGGTQPLVRGSVSLRGQKITDFCAADGKLWEYRCTSPGSFTSMTYTCATPCQDGACTPLPPAICGNGIVETPETCDDGNTTNYDGCGSLCKTESSCNDSDGGNVSTTSGFVQFGAMTFQDSCVSNAVIKEYICYNRFQMGSISFNCPYGCLNNVCLSAPMTVCGNNKIEETEQCDDGNLINYDGCGSLCKIESTCSDSDGGNWPAVNGFVQYGMTKFSDSCVTPLLVKEHICLSTYQMASVLVSCAYGCANNSCLLAPLSVCGNGVVEIGEQCDDSNAVAGDGCSATCQTEQTIDLTVSKISYARLPSTDTTDTITVSISAFNNGPAYSSARSITATLIAGATDEYPSGFTWRGEATVILGVNNGVGIDMGGQYIVPRNKPVNFPVTATVRFAVPTPDPNQSNNTLQTSINAEKALDPCTDTDGGMVYDQKGAISTYVSGGAVYTGVYDTCYKDQNKNPVNPKMLVETYCDALGIGRMQNYECPYGCSDGACLPSP